PSHGKLVLEQRRVYDQWRNFLLGQLFSMAEISIAQNGQSVAVGLRLCNSNAHSDADRMATGRSGTTAGMQVKSKSPRPRGRKRLRRCWRSCVTDWSSVPAWATGTRICNLNWMNFDRSRLRRRPSQ